MLPFRNIWMKTYIKYGYDHIISIIKLIIISHVVYVSLTDQNQAITRKKWEEFDSSKKYSAVFKLL